MEVTSSLRWPRQRVLISIGGGNDFFWAEEAEDSFWRRYRSSSEKFFWVVEGEVSLRQWKGRAPAITASSFVMLYLQWSFDETWYHRS